MIKPAAAFLLFGLAAPVFATLPPDALEASGVAPPAGARLPTSLPFVDQDGRPARVAPTGTSTVLLFADYSCAHLCGPGLTLTAGALADAGLRPGSDYRLLLIGLDQDGPAAARAMRDRQLSSLPAVRADVRMLTGTPATIRAATAALGYHATYDADTDQFAHDAASFVFTPAGALSAVLPETAATPDMVRAAIQQARAGKQREAAVPSPAEGLVALCYGFAAAHGVHGAAAVTALRVAGLATVALLGLLVWRLATRRRRPA